MSAQGLVISTVESDSLVAVTVRGEIDMLTVPQFSAALAPAFAGPARAARIDLSEVEYFGSQAVRALVEARETGRANGVVLTVCGASPVVRKVLEIVGLDDLIEDT